MTQNLVFQPIMIGQVQIPNRVVRTAHSSHGDAIYDDRAIAYHEARAKGGCGMTILGSSAVHPSSVAGKHIFTDNIIPSFQALMAACRPHGMRVFQQLYHAGNIRPGLDRQPPWAVSERPGYTGLVGIPMDEGQILEIIDSFVSAARRCRDGGLDGIEVHAAHGYLPQQFLSPNLNTRTDKWGGDFAGRSRFLLEVLRAIRQELPDLALGVRLSASEAPNDVTLQDNIDLVHLMQAEQLIDYLNVSKGTYFRFDTMLSGMHAPAGYELDLTTQITAHGTVPRIVSGRFRTLEEAEQVIREGSADLVSMVRAQIADPDLVRKSREGRADQVRPCIACNQGCFAAVARAEGLGCTVNPAVGHEAYLSEELITRTSEPKKVLIVGGGPAGMEAARVAATAGHHVILAEAMPNLGGAVNTARKAPKLATIGDITHWLEQEVYRLGVEVRLSTYLDAVDIRAEQADLVLVATGASPRMDGFQFQNPGVRIAGVEQPHVISSRDLLDGAAPIGGTALVMDSVGHYECLATLETLLANGTSTTFVTHHRSMAPFIETTERDGPAFERMCRLARYGEVRDRSDSDEVRFNILTRHWLVEIAKGECVVKPNHAGNDLSRRVPAETVVLITPDAPRRELYEELKPESNGRVALIGDAYAPRDLQQAIAHGHQVMRRFLQP